MSARTLSERILSAHAGVDAVAGDMIVCEADLILGTDGSTPMALDCFEAMGGTRVRHADRVLLSRDHYAPPDSPSTIGFHTRMDAFARAHGIELLGVGDGIGFQVALETGRVRPGDLVVGADSHTVMCGAVGAFATGIGSADLAGALLTGRVWLRVPETLRVVLEGGIPAGVGAKDIALEMVRALGADGAGYRAIEFHGPAAAALPVEERMVLSNLSAETGAKAGIFPDPSMSVADVAASADDVVIDVGRLEPQIARPHDPANVVAVREAEGEPIDFVFLGTCAGGRTHDFREALRILNAGGGIAPGVTVVVTPPTAAVRTALEREGILGALTALGAIVTETGCGACCGTSGVIPPPGAHVLSTANRNFRARMGEPTAAIWLASPATCAATAVTGRITDPRTIAPPAGPAS